MFRKQHSEEYIEAYRAGFYDGADCKQNFKLHMLGYEVEELLKIISEHELKCSLIKLFEETTPDKGIIRLMKNENNSYTLWYHGQKVWGNE